MTSVIAGLRAHEARTYCAFPNSGGIPALLLIPGWSTPSHGSCARARSTVQLSGPGRGRGIGTGPPEDRLSEDDPGRQGFGIRIPPISIYWPLPGASRSTSLGRERLRTLASKPSTDAFGANASTPAGSWRLPTGLTMHPDLGGLAGAEGLEPPTCGFGDRRSTN